MIMTPTLMTVLGFVIAFAVTAAIGMPIIKYLKKLKFGQKILEEGPKWHMSKQYTPTMGGIMFIIGIAAAILIAGIPSMRAGDMRCLTVLLFALVFGIIGAIDDITKIKKKRNMGLTAWQKLLLQIAASVLFITVLRHMGHLTPNIYFPFIGVTVPVSWVFYIPFAVLVIVGAVNAVNLTDGIDGLAAGVTVPVAVFFAVVCIMWNMHSPAVFSAALAGALCGFLIFNFNPAKVFMGDTGSLFLGGAVCGLAFACDMPIILIPVGIIYVVEALSDIIQVLYFKATHGKRFFKMAPLHHHLELCGWSEKKIVLVFTLITVAMCVLSYFGVLNRYPM